jgi:hypothetical protein
MSLQIILSLLQTSTAQPQTMPPRGNPNNFPMNQMNGQMPSMPFHPNMMFMQNMNGGGPSEMNGGANMPDMMNVRMQNMNGRMPNNMGGASPPIMSNANMPPGGGVPTSQSLQQGPQGPNRFQGMPPNTAESREMMAAASSKPNDLTSVVNGKTLSDGANDRGTGDITKTLPDSAKSTDTSPKPPPTIAAKSTKPAGLTSASAPILLKLFGIMVALFFVL